ncbi:hydrolase [bacterium]|nr:hydrolase [bacterium]
MSRHPDLLHVQRCGLIVIDIQEKFVPVISDAEEIIRNTIRLIEAFRLFERPVLLTEQYPKGLGATVKPVLEKTGEYEPLQKTSFSCLGISGFAQKLRSGKVHQAVVCGIETHVCVWQTVMDLLCEGFHVTVVRNAVSSRHAIDRDTAIERMIRAGIHVSTLETVLFEMLETAEHPSFRPVQALIK